MKLKYVHWELCEESNPERVGKSYEHRSDRAIENEGCKIFWIIHVECDKELKLQDQVLQLLFYLQGHDSNCHMTLSTSFPWSMLL